MFARVSAAVLFAMQQEALAECVAVAPARFHGDEHSFAFGSVHQGLQGGRLAILSVHRQDKGEDDAISFLARHVLHPVTRTRRSFAHARWERVKGVAIPSRSE